MKHLALVIGLVALLAPAPASASIIEVEFTGLASTFNPSMSPFAQFTDKSFTADFVFNTALGTLTETADGHRLQGGFVSGFSSVIGSVFPPPAVLTWRDDLSFVSAVAGFPLVAGLSIFIEASELGVHKPPLGFGQFQQGQCPGGLCGWFSQIDTVSMTIDGVPVAVPGPVVGSGLPALLLMAGAWLWRRQQKKPPGDDRGGYSVVGRLAPSA